MLLSVIVLGMVMLSVALYSSWLSVFVLEGSAAAKHSAQARYLADTCAEIALQKIWDSSSYTGSGSFSGFNGSCTYVVSSSGGENRQINTTGVLGNVTRKVKVLVDKVILQVNVSSWQEVADF